MLNYQPQQSSIFPVLGRSFELSRPGERPLQSTATLRFGHEVREHSAPTPRTVISSEQHGASDMSPGSLIQAWLTVPPVAFARV